MTDLAAILDIGHFYTTLTVHVGGDRQRHNIIGEPSDGDWNTNPTGYFRTAADRHLTALGYTRTGEWRHDPTVDGFAAPLAVTERSHT